MNLAESFLVFTTFSYFVFASVPKPTTKNVKPRWLERLVMAFCGFLLLLNLWLGIRFVWLIYGIFWSVASCLSYLGYSQWNVLWREDLSDEAQMVMFFWDLMIAVCCMMLS